MKLPKDPKSEAALKWAVKNWDKITVMCFSFAPVLTFFIPKPGQVAIEREQPFAELDLREVIRKRQALTGVRKQMDTIVRGKRKVKKRSGK